MNKSFSFTRLWRLIIKQGMENARFYLLFCLACLGITGVLIGYWITIKTRNGLYEEHFYSYMLLGLFICGTLFANLQFSDLSKKAHAITWLSLPASHLEKFLSGLFYTVIVFNGLFLVGVLITKWLLVYCLTLLFPGEIVWHAAPPFFESEMVYFLYVYFAVQSFYLLGSVYFVRFSFVKTTVLMAFLMIGGAYYFFFLQSRLLPGPFNWSYDGRVIAYSWSIVGLIPFEKVYEPAPALSQTAFFLLKWGWAPVFWIITCTRLTEKEI